MSKIESYNLINKARTVRIESEWEISLMTIRNDITVSHIPIMNGASMRLSRAISSC